MKDALKRLFAPNMYRGHAIMLSTFVSGQIYFILAVAGFSAAIGLFAGILTAPIGFFTGATTLYVLRRATNLELKGFRKEAKHHGIELQEIDSVEGGDLFELSRDLYSDRTSWKVLAGSLLKFPIGMASFVAVVSYISISASLILSPLLYRPIEYRIYSKTLDTIPEVSVAFLGGVVLFVAGANIVEKASVLYLRFNRLVSRDYSG